MKISRKKVHALVALAMSCALERIAQEGEMTVEDSELLDNCSDYLRQRKGQKHAATAITLGKLKK